MIILIVYQVYVEGPVSFKLPLVFFTYSLY